MSSYMLTTFELLNISGIDGVPTGLEGNPNP